MRVAIRATRCSVLLRTLFEAIKEAEDEDCQGGVAQRGKSDVGPTETNRLLHQNAGDDKVNRLMQDVEAEGHHQARTGILQVQLHTER